VKNSRAKSRVLIALLVFASSLITLSAAQKNLPSEHVPAGVAHGKIAPLGHLAGTNQLRLAIGLPLRHADALTNLLREMYDPASPQYHHYLTPAEFTARFGPTPEEYAAVTRFAKENGFSIRMMARSAAERDQERQFFAFLIKPAGKHGRAA